MVPWLVGLPIAILWWFGVGAWAQTGDVGRFGSTDTAVLKRAVREAFREVHQGYSSDEVLLDDALNRAFLIACRRGCPEATDAQCNWTLLNLRKAGKLSDIPTTRRRRDATDAVLPLAEIAARSVIDRTGDSIDAILCDPVQRQEFDRMIRQLDPGADPYLARKAALRLRKSRRLRPELIARIADWGRTIREFRVSEVRTDWNRVPEQPGVYIFRDSTGYLYIGQSNNLRARLQSHLEASSSAGLSRYLAAQSDDEISIEIHAFPADSRARETMVRRAYESELIRTRQPRFNIQP